MTSATIDSAFSLSSTWLVILILSICIVYGLLRECWYIRNNNRGSSNSSSWFGISTQSNSGISSSNLFTTTLLGRNNNIVSPSKVTNTVFPYGVSESMGRRNYMEDRHCVAGELLKHPLFLTNNKQQQRNMNESTNNTVVTKNTGNIPSSFYGVYDGHGGIAAANYCVTHMVNNLVSHSSFPSQPDQALRHTFNRTDSDFLGKANNCFPPLDDGTCAIVALIVQNILYVANVGDSRAVLITTASSASASSNLNSTSIRLTTPNSFNPQNTNKNFTVISLSEDHKPLRSDELRRIKELGGNVVFHGVWRVEGILAVSRAIGDRLLKRYVTSDPELRRYELRTPYDIAIVLASDGVWDVLTNSDVANIVLSAKDSQTAADNLIQAALQAGSMDNVTAIVIDLTRPKENIWSSSGSSTGTNDIKVSSGAAAIGKDHHPYTNNPIVSRQNNSNHTNHHSLAGPSSPSVNVRSDEESGPSEDNPLLLHDNGLSVVHTTVPSLITINNPHNISTVSSSFPSSSSTPSSSVRLQRMEYGIDIGSPHVKLIETSSSGIDTTTDFNDLINNLNNHNTNIPYENNVLTNDNVYLDSLITTTTTTTSSSSSSSLLNNKQSKKGNQIITKRSTQSTKRDDLENHSNIDNNTNSNNDDSISSPAHNLNSTNNSNSTGNISSSEHGNSGMNLLSNSNSTSSTKRD